MLRLAIILTAIFMGIALGVAIANRYWKRRRGRDYYADEELVSVPRAYPLWRVLLPRVVVVGVVGFAVLFLGLFLLTTGEEAAIYQRYHPAELKDGEIIPYRFDGADDDNSQ